MNSARFWPSAGRLAALIVAAGPALLGQSVSVGTVSGTILDSGNRPVAEALVRVDTGRGIREYKSDSQGRFVLFQLLPGEVKIQVTAKGYSSSTIRVNVISNQNSKTNIRLAPVAEARVEVVAISNQEVGVDRSVAMTGTNITAEQIEALPVLGNDVLSRILVTSPGTPSGGLNFHGSDDNTNNFTVNGAETRSMATGVSVVVLNRDLLEQVSVLTGGVSARYGRFVGGNVSAVTKTGGNEFSGSASFQMTSRSWDALPVETPEVLRVRVPRHVATTQNYTFMGPLIKDKLFFTAGYMVTTPGVTEQVKGGVNSQLFAPYSFTSLSSNATKDLKIDWQINPDHRVFAAWNDHSTEQSQPVYGYGLSSLAVGPGANEYNAGMKSFGYAGILSSNMTLDVILSESFTTQKEAGCAVDPNIVSWQDTMYGDWYDNGYTPRDKRDEKIRTLGANFTWTPEKHTVEAGFQYYSNRIENKGRNDYSGNPVTPSNLFIKFAGWVPAPPSMDRQYRVMVPNDIWSTQLAVFNPLIGRFESSVWGLYLNDVWAVDNHWTVNLGVRFDSNQLKVNPEGHRFRIGTPVPRFSVSYDLSGDKKHLFTLNLSEYAGTIDVATFRSISLANYSPSRIYAYYGLGTGSDALNADGSINWNVWGNSPTTLGPNYDVAPQQSSKAVRVESNIKPPRSREVSLSYRYADPKQSLSATLLHKLQDNYIENKKIGAPGLGLPGPNGEQPVGADSVYWNDPDAKCRYESLEIQYQRQIFEGLTASGNLTWSYTHANAGQGFPKEVRNQFGDMISNELISPMGYQPGQNASSTTPFMAHANATYRHDFGKMGTVTATLSGNYWSKSFMDYRSISGLVDQDVMDYGYSPIIRRVYTDAPLWWPEQYGFDLHLGYDIELWRKVKAFAAFDVMNVFNHVMPLFKRHYSALSDGTTLYGVQLADGTYNPAPAGWYNNPNMRPVPFNPPPTPWSPESKDGEIAAYSEPRRIQLRVGFRF